MPRAVSTQIGDWAYKGQFDRYLKKISELNVPKTVYYDWINFFSRKADR